MRLRVFLGSKCNNFCTLCSVRGEKIRKDKLKDILNAINNKKIESINFLGGEPTINKYIIYFIKECKRKGVKEITITSNGRRLSYPSFCKKLIDSGLTSINISVYGPQKIHESITRTPGSFKQTIGGIKNLLNSDLETNINLVVNKINKDYIFKTVDLVNKINPQINRIRLVFINPFGEAKSKPYLFPRFSDLKKELQNSEKFKEKLVLLDFPYCVVSKSFRERVSTKEDKVLYSSKIKDYPPKLKQKLKTCYKCRFNEKCEGIFKYYLALYGKKEFRPIK